MSSGSPSPTPMPLSTAVTTVVSTVAATMTRAVFPSDPYLAYQPAFAYSLPIQFLLTGVILALCAILLIHLVFTAPYHWPMAKVNYTLQLSGVCSLLLTLGVTLSVISANVHGTSREWPYMLNYVAVDIPMSSWTAADNGLWYTLDAVTSGLAHATHIQFLTYLYPSDIERRLIFILLGPIVLASSLSSFLELAPSASTRAIADSVKNICNTTLAILFSVALGVWGFFINRKEAWRTDGGTAIFGGGAIALSLFSMGLNLYQIAKVPPIWIPPLLWDVVLWQSFLGWWWYIGSDAPEPPRRQSGYKRNRSKAKTDDKKLSRMKTKLGLSDPAGLRRRNQNNRLGSTSDNQVGDVTVTTNAHANASLLSPPDSTTFLARIAAPITTFLYNLRVAHMNAVEQQAAENEAKRFEVYGDGRYVRGVPGNGWGLGSFATRLPIHYDQSTVDEGPDLDAESRNGHDGAWGGRLADDNDNARGGSVSIPMRDLQGERREIDNPEMGAESRRIIWDDDERQAEGTWRTTGRGGTGRKERVPVERLSKPQPSWSWFGLFRRWRLKDASIFN